jgi:hypothetical protein
VQTTFANQTLETNCRPASPLVAWLQFEHAVHAQPCVSGGSRSALTFALKTNHEKEFNNIRGFDVHRRSFALECPCYSVASRLGLQWAKRKPKQCYLGEGNKRSIYLYSVHWWFDFYCCPNHIADNLQCEKAMKANKASLSTPAPPRVQPAMTIQPSTSSRSLAPGQV